MRPHKPSCSVLGASHVVVSETVRPLYFTLSPTSQITFILGTMATFPGALDNNQLHQSPSRVVVSCSHIQSAITKNPTRFGRILSFSLSIKLWKVVSFSFIF